MPYLEYLELWKKLSSVIGPDGRLQLDAVITESHYTAVVKESFAEVNATLQVQVLGERWSEVTLELGDAAIGSVSSEQGDVVLRGIGEGKYSLLFEKPGRYTVQMTLNTGVHVSPEGRTITLKVPSVGITTFEMQVPKADQTVDVKPKLVELPVEAVEGETGTRIRGSLGATNQITATWYPRAGLKPDMELLAGVTNLQKISLQEGLVHTEAQLTYSILRGTLGQVRLAIPLGDRILDVNSPDQPIAAWETQQDDKQQTVVVRFLSDINRNVRVDVRTERTLPNEPFQVAGASAEGKPAGVHALDVVRESGQITLSSGSDVNLVVQSADGLVRVIESEVAAEFRRPEAIYYKFYNPKFNLTVEGRPVAARITVDHQAAVEFQEDELSITSQLNYTIERAGVFDVRLRVPKGVTVDNVQVAGLREYTTAGDTLTVSFAEQTQGGVVVQIRGHMKFDAEATTTESFALPLLEPLGVERETGVLRVYSLPGLEVIADTEKIVGAVSTAAAGQLQQGSARMAATGSITPATS